MKRALLAVAIALVAPLAHAAQVSTKGVMWLPAYEFWAGGPGPALAGHTLDAAADRYAMIIRAPKAGTIGKFRIRLGTVTSIGGSSTLRVSIQDVDATTGFPDETDDQFRDIASGSIVSSASILTGLVTSDGTDTGTKRTVTRGETFVVVVKFGTFTAADQIVMAGVSVATRGGRTHWEYAASNATGAYAKAATTLSMVSIQYDDGTYAETAGTVPVVSLNTLVAYNNTSTPDEIGLRFQVPFSCKVGQAWLGVDADGDFELVLYDGSTATVVATFDKDVRLGTVGQLGHVIFTAEQTLAANTTYVLALKPTSATNITLQYIDVAEAAEFNQWGGGTEMYYATAKDPTNASSFATTTTRRPMIGLGITSVDDGASTGGVSAARVPNGM